MEIYNTKRVQQIESGYILNIINFNFDKKWYELKYSCFECTITEFCDDNSNECLKIYDEINWKKEKFIKMTNNKNLGDVCDEIYDYYHMH